MARICPLFSGSTGNSTYIGTRHGGILVDAGASARALCEALERAGGSCEEIAAIAVTHHHIDHIKGLKPMLKKTGAVLIASVKTAEALADADKIPVGTRVITLDENSSAAENVTPAAGSLNASESENHITEAAGTAVSRFATSHDCVGSGGFVFTLPDGRKIAVCTDLGVVTDGVRRALRGCDTVLIESNHDIEMLKNGPYPPELKLRIMSESGHISNNACAAELPGLLMSGTKRIILGHLSLKNNLPMLAKSCAEAALIDIGAENGRDYLLTVAAPSENRVTVL